MMRMGRSFSSLSIRVSAAIFAVVVWCGHADGGEKKAGDEPKEAAEAGSWGTPVDGITCRLTMRPRFSVGQSIPATIEVKNTSDKKRFLALRLDPFFSGHLALELTGPMGRVKQRFQSPDVSQAERDFGPIEPGEVKRFAVPDLCDFFDDLIAWLPNTPAPKSLAGEYSLQFRFKSPKVPPRWMVSYSFDNGKKTVNYKDVPPEVTAGQWAGEALSSKVTFQIAPLEKNDLVVHEWGVFTVFNDVKFANIDRKNEWADLPSFFYRQFPQERLRWMPAAWDKPIVYFYAKPTPMTVNVKLTFSEGAPVVWWPAVMRPVEDRPYQTGPDPRKTKPFQTLEWLAWLGDQAPPLSQRGPMVKVEDFALPDNCWLKDARLPDASRVTVIGNIEGPPKVRFPGGKDRLETERFLYYDGLVPAPSYVRCEQVEPTSVTLKNNAKFDITRLFVVDRRAKEAVGFGVVDGSNLTLKAGASLKIPLKAINPEDWPFVGVKETRQALVEAGLFEPEADALLKIWSKRFFQAEGITVYHILPRAEYDRMLPIEIRPAPAASPVRVGIALHPHIEIEPGLTERVGALIKQLDSPVFEKRLAADTALREIGPLAMGLLTAELKKELTTEARHRIQNVLERFDAADWLTFPVPAKQK